MKRHTYTEIGRGVELDGWFRIRLRRDDGREVSVPRKRYAQLNREGRIVSCTR